MTRFWKKFNTSYEVSHDGEVRSVDRIIHRSDTGTPVLYKGVLQAQSTHRCGYKRVRISLDNKRQTHYVHRLVAEAFIKNPDKLPQVNHKDGDKTNNHFENLEWCDNGYNQRHAIEMGLKIHHSGEKATRFEGAVQAFNSSGILVATMYGNKDMKRHGFDFRLVSACLHGKRKTHNGCTFVKLPKEI